MSEIWDFLQSAAGSAASNMALDEVLLRTAAKRGRPLLRLYLWEKPAVSFGYFQRFPAHLAGPPHLDPLPQTTTASRGLRSPASGQRKFPTPFLKGEGEGIDQIVRRPTGGGLVYHGDGVDTTYTVVVPRDHRLYTMSTTDAYCTIHKAVAAAIGDQSRITNHQSPVPRTGYECFQQPVAGDVVADGHKLAGAAQRRTKSGMLHQGSIAAKLSADHLKRSFKETLGVEFMEYELTEPDGTLAEKLACEKYATDAWNRRLR